MGAQMTTVDRTRHLIALHLGAESRYVDSTEAEAAYVTVTDEARGWLADTFDTLSVNDLSDAGALHYVEAYYVGSLAAFIDSGIL